MNFENFIEKAKLIHGDKYDYINENFGGKVTIICKKHGKFIQRIYDHLSNHGCPKCGKEEYSRKNSEKARNEFVSKACSVHGDKYDYSKTNYVNNKTPVEIICKKHGSFFQSPNNHVNGQGCPKCAHNQKLTQEEFMKRTKKIYGNKYDYSKVKYENINKKIVVICPEHGEFAKNPYSFLNGSGCPKCNIEKMSTDSSLGKENFINNARKIHGDKYCYSKAEYKNNRTKICIICPEHGEFLQTPTSHLQGAGCPKCGIEKIKKFLTSNTKEFIFKARSIHGDKYDYSKTNYVNATSKVCIICPEHGEFWQLPHSHLRGRGCQKCGRKNSINGTIKFYGRNLENFIEDARKVHGNDFDYTLSKYKNAYTKILIKCNKCGTVFKQSPSKHLYGRGCPKCKSSNAEKEIRTYFDLKNIKYESEKTFPGLNSDKNIPLRFDFYLPERNMCIEFDGMQHFSHTKWLMSKEDFERLKKHDKLKDEYCKIHGIRLIRLRKNCNEKYEIWKDIK